MVSILMEQFWIVNEVDVLVGPARGPGMHTSLALLNELKLDFEREASDWQEVMGV